MLRPEQPRSLRASVTSLFFRAFLIAAPLNLYGLGSGSFNYRFSRILLVLTLLGILAERLGNPRPLVGRLLTYDRLLVLYAGLALASGIYAARAGPYVVRLLGLIECVLILFVVRSRTSTLEGLESAIKTYALSAIPVAIGAGYQLYGLQAGNFDTTSALPLRSLLLYESYADVLDEVGHFGGAVDGFMRISSTFGEPNMLGGYCASILPLVIVLVLRNTSRGEKKKAVGYGLLVVLVALTMISTISKAAILCTFVSVSIMVSLVFKTLPASQRRAIMLICAAILAVIAAYAVLAENIFTHRLELGDSGHLEHRLAALETFYEHPLLGLGFGNYEVVSAHTLLLTALVELGIAGGLVILAMSVVPLLAWNRANRALLARLEPGTLWVFSACYASYCSVLVGLYLYDYWIHPFTWLSIAFLLSITSQLEQTQSAADGAEPSRA